MAYVGKITGTDGTTGLVGSTLYGTCSTAAGTVAKTVTLAEFDTLITGVTVHVKMTNSNTATNPTLNVNSTGAKSICRNGTTKVGNTEGTSWVAGAMLSFTYDGTNWVLNDAVSYPLAHTHPDQDVKWGTTNMAGNWSTVDALFNEYLSPNRFAGAIAAGITVEYSTDAGSTWSTYPDLSDATKRNIFTNRTSSLRIGGPASVTPSQTANTRLRITLNTASAGIYTTLYKLHIYIGTNRSQGTTVTIKAATHGDPTNFSKTICTNQTISGWTSWNVIAIPSGLTTYGNSDSQYQYIQFTFSHTGTTSGYESAGLLVYSIFGFGGVGWTTPSQMAINGHAYTYSGDGTSTFPKAVVISSGGLGVTAGGINVAGGNITCSNGTIVARGNQYADSYSGALNMNNSNIYGLNSIYTADASDEAAEGFHFYRDTTHVDTFRIASGKMYFYANRTLGQNPNPTGVVLHTGNTTVTQTLTSGTAIGSISLDGTSTTLYAPTPTTNTDENVKQSVSTTADYRPIALGKHTWTAGSIPSTDPTTVTDQIYGTSNLYVKPSTGSLLTKGYLECVTNNSGLWLTDSSSNDFGAVYCGSNFWIGAANSSDRAHIGVTYISTGYDSTNLCGYSTIFVSIPNADNTGQSESWGVLHKGNTSVTQVLSSGTKIATISLGATSTDLYAPTNTDTKVNVALATTTKAYLLGTSTTPTGTAQAVTSVGDTGVFLTTTAGRLQAGTYAITSGSYAHILKAGSTNLSANAEHTFPNTGGTVLNTGTTSYTADANAPTSSTTGAYAIGTLKINGSSYSIYGKDTDTWMPMTGATNSANGTVGYINSIPPQHGYNIMFWRADGSWAVPQDTTYSAGTGLTLASGNKFDHTDSLPAQATIGFYKVKYNATGHITGTTAVAASDITGLGIVGTDENVKQSVSTTTDYRPIALGKHTWTTGSIPSTDPTTVTDQIFGTSNLYVKPSTGSLFTKGYLECVTNNSGLWLTDSSSNDFGAVYSGSNFWIGAANSSSRAHTGVTYISTGYDSTNQCGYSTIFVSIPNADNSGQLAQNGSFGVLHKGNTTVTQVLSSGTKIATISLGADSTDLYAPTNTDTKVNVTLATTSKAYLLATTTAPTSSAQAVTSVGDTGVYLTSSAGVLHATTFEGSLNGTITVTETHGDGTTPTTQKTYYVPFMVDKQSTNYIRGNDGIRYATYDGDTTASPKTPGTASLRLGNNKTLNDTGNMRGSLLLFGSGADYIQVLPTTLTSYRTIYFPDEGGTIALKTQADINEMINLLGVGTSVPVDNDYYVSQYVNGGTTTTTYHRRSVLSLWQYMKSKMTNGSNVSFSTDSTTKVLTISASDANVTQTELALDASYEVLFAGTADSTTHTEGVGKSSAVTLNPSSGNLTTTGAFVLKEGSYTGTITQNTLTANRTWTFPKHASGIIHIEQRANFYDDTTGVTSTPWQKVASLTTGAASTDRTATFIVAANYSGDVDKKFGIAQCHLRTNGSKVFSSAELTWLYKSPQLFLSDIVLLYKSVANTSTTIEIWAKSIRRYSGYTFTLLDEHDRKGVISGQWELTTNNGATGSASLPSGFTAKDSRILSDGTLLATETYSGSDNTHTITNTDYDWDSFSLILLHIKTGTTSGLGDNYITIPIPWKDFNDYFDSQTSYNNNGYIPYGLSQYSSGIFLMGNHHQGFTIALGTGSWSSTKTIKVIGIV